MSLTNFLTYAAGPGINAIVGFILSFILEWLPGFTGASPRAKRLITMLLCFAVPTLATVGLCSLAGSVTVEDMWRALSAGFAAFFLSQAAHTRELTATTWPPPGYNQFGPPNAHAEEEAKILFGTE